MPLSLILLSLLRCGQIISDRTDLFHWFSNKAVNIQHIDLATYNCVHGYTIEILSIDPLVIYLNDFLSDMEIEYLLSLA